MSRRPEQIGVTVVPHGLFLPMLRPPAGEDDEFNDWYDTEHAPARAAVPGFLTARRWQAVPGWDGTDTIDPDRAAAEAAEPLHYVATFDLDELAVLESTDYLELREKASQRERKLASRFTLNDRRIYRPVPLPEPSRWSDLEICGPLMLLQWWESDEGEPDALHDALAQATRADGVLRARLFERQDAEHPGRFLAAYDLTSLDAFHDDRWLATATAREHDVTRRLYRLWRRFDPVGG